MTISSALTALNTDIQNARTAITNKGGTITSNGGSAQLASDISTITELKGSSKSVTLTATSQTFYPDNNKNAITSINVSARNYDRTVNPATSTQQLNIISGYSGNGIVTINPVTASIDNHITPENIKKSVTILGVTGTYEGSGGGGGGGYTLEYKYAHSGGQHLELTINDTLTFPLFDGWGNMAGVKTRILIPNITSFTVDSIDRGYWGDCTIEVTVGGSTRALSPGETVTLTQDTSLYIVEGDCLLKGTIITMADGSFKEISMLKLGDKILSINPETLEQEEDEVTYCDGNTKKYNDNYDLWEFENGYQVRTTHHHRFYNVERQAMVYLDEWNIGEHTIDFKGNQVALLKHTNLIKEVHHFTLATKNWNIYFANGLVCGNRNSTEIHLGTEEQKQVQSNPSESIGSFI